ncbi:MAG TPA: 7TM-DISM domain-containing protein, partial [Leptospiraceae bacterium]|nr:7TM-DISM domain-containing protein [Leptospiraceae bacterium]
MKIFLTVLLMTSAVSLYPQKSGEAFLSVKEKSGSHLVGKYLYVYEDSTNSLGIEDVSNPSFSDKFQRNSKDTVSRSYSYSSIWIKLNLKRESYSDSGFLMEISYPHLDHIEVYCLRKGHW